MKIIKIASSLGSLKKGSELAPDKIDKQLESIFSNEEEKYPNIEIETPSFTNIEEAYQDDCIFVGGDHLITYSLFKAFSKKHNNNALIIFDAHPDIVNSNNLNHYNWIKFLLDENYIKPENIIIIGLRASALPELNYLKINKIKYIPMKNIFNNVEYTCDIIMEFARKFDKCYLSLDIDVVDPAFAPGTNYLEPGGLTSRELIYFIQRLTMLKNLTAVDIVEVNPKKDVNDITSKLAAKLIFEILK